MSTRTREQLCKDLNEINKQLQFKDAHLELVSEESLDNYLKFLEIHFFPDEVLTKSIGLVVDKGVMEVMKHLLPGNLSILLVSDITKEIIACRGLAIGQRGKTTDLPVIENAKVKLSFDFLFPEQEKEAIYDYYSVDVCVQFIFLGTHREHRKQGIANKMMQAALLFCNRLGLETVCIKGDATSYYSQRIYEKHGFETIRTSRYDEYKIDGEVVFRNTGEHESFKVYVKKLS